MEISGQNRNSLGLTTVEAKSRLKKFGRNEIASESRLTQVQQFLKILSDPMGLMMLGLSVLYFFTGDLTDAIIILVAYIPVTAIDVFLELRSEKALNALKSNLQTTAKVFRDGNLIDIPIQLLVPGDVIAFEEGQALPADGKIIEFHSLSINESALTGESVPVEKQNDAEFFAGTSILVGRGLGLIQKTGQQTKFGKISHLLEETQGEESPLQKKVHALVKKVVFVAAGLALLLFSVAYFRGNGFMKSLITALTFGMAAVPEEFPLVFTLYLSLGAWRLSKLGVLVKTLPSVESLGNVDVICTDKTGTLTEGKFSLVEVVPFGPGDERERNTIALLACEKNPTDSMELAITSKIEGFEALKKTWKLTYDYPFDGQGKHMTHIWTNPQGEYVLAMKGAVEGVLEHAQITTQERQELLQRVDQLSAEGKRILGLASKKGHFTGERSADEQGVQLIGLLVFSDPVRKSAKAAIQDLQDAGIEMKMLTGDHRLTAHAIAEELNIIHTDQTIYTGSELTEMNPEVRSQAYLNGSIFARLMPEQKYELVKALKAAGKVVAMTGDGVNDSPALKLADIGVSMGENATDVARSTAKMILLKNDYNGIVQAFLEGRNIFTNLRRSFSYLIAFHIPIVLLALVPPLMGWRQLLLPVHIILLELIVHPISAFSFENLKFQQIGPTKNNKQLVPFSTAITAALSGLLLTLLSLLPMYVYREHVDFNYVRTLCLSIVLFGNIGFTLIEGWRQVTSKRIMATVFTLLVISILLSKLSFFQSILSFENISAKEILITLSLGLLASFPTFLLRFSRWDR